MFEIDKVQFGAFVAQLRKEKGYTQKELAKRLFISDKAISKWETGISIPDVSLLIPLAELLDVTVTELLECKRMEVQQPMEDIVKKAVRYSEEEEAERTPKTKRIRTLLIAVAVSVLQVLFILSIEGEYTAKMTDLVLMTLLGTVFGSYFWIFGREHLPSYYDENRISAYADGFFRMNAPGIVFNNKNWPYIMRVGRIWTIAMLDLYPVLYFIGMHLPGDAWMDWGETSLTVFCLIGLIVPIYVVGKKYK